MDCSEKPGYFVKQKRHDDKKIKSYLIFCLNLAAMMSKLFPFLITVLL